MRTTTSSKKTGSLSRAKAIWKELDYAQRRLFEIQTGIPVLEREERPRIRSADSSTN
jgi:hypothetical protein